MYIPPFPFAQLLVPTKCLAFNSHVLHGDAPDEPNVYFLPHGLLFALDELGGAESEGAEESTHRPCARVLQRSQLLDVLHPTGEAHALLTQSVGEEEHRVLADLRQQARQGP